VLTAAAAFLLLTAWTAAILLLLALRILLLILSGLARLLARLLVLLLSRLALVAGHRSSPEKSTAHAASRLPQYACLRVRGSRRARRMLWYGDRSQFLPPRQDLLPGVHWHGSASRLDAMHTPGATAGA
jgi:hypothetical protein